MPHASLNDPAVTVALALMAGTVAQVIARQLGLPAIVLLLALGVLLGPQFASLVHPSTLGGGLFVLVGFAVAVILFEGGMNLQIARIRRENRAIGQLVTWGALVTAIGGMLSARLLLGWSWALSGLFGTLVIVTGPTVIGPMVRRLRVEQTTSTVLEAEGVFIDAIGAILATVALDIALRPTGRDAVAAIVHGVWSLALGSAIGAAAGVALGYLLKLRRVVPEGLENILTLSYVLSLFHVANAVVPESGVAAVTAAGVAVGNIHSHVHRSLHAFKQELTTLLIGMLFVLLAADVELADVQALGKPGLWVVAMLMLVVRPANVLVGTYRSGLNWRQKTFLAWIGPRGIVAAAIASLFAAELENGGVAGGPQLRALVFLVIGATVLVAGLTGGLLSSVLGLRRATEQGWVILGANELARAVGRALSRWGEDVVLIDTNPHHATAAERDGLRVLNANGLDPSVLHRALIDTRAGALGLSTNSQVNLSFAERAKSEGKLTRRYAGIGRSQASYNLKHANESDTRVLFGQPADLEHWVVRLRRGDAQEQTYVYEGEEVRDDTSTTPLNGLDEGSMLPMLLRRRATVQPVGEQTPLRRDDQIAMLIDATRRDEVDAQLARIGLRPLQGEEQPEAAA